jgi:RluA family pseudouridine synthase
MRRQFVTILYEDDAMLVVDKPAGLLSTPDRAGEDETVLTVLTGALELPPEQQLRLVHRLDRETSGVMLVAKTRDAQRALSKQFAAHTVAKTYLALVRGAPNESSGRIDAPLIQRAGGLMAASPGAKRAQKALTEWALIERFAGYALLRCRPHTGRQHQIRAHLQYAGMPLAVDPEYGGDTRLLLSRFKADYRPSRRHPERPLIARVSLHAESIELDHPSDRRRCRFEATPPKDFRAALNQLRRHAVV